MNDVLRRLNISHEPRCAISNAGLPQVTPPASRPRTTDSGPRTPDHGLQTPDHKLQTPDHGTPDSRLRTTDSGLRTTIYGLRTTDYGPRTTDHGVRTTDYRLRTPALRNLIRERMPNGEDTDGREEAGDNDSGRGTDEVGERADEQLPERQHPPGHQVNR